VTPTASAVSGVNVPGHVGMFFCIVPKDENSTGIQIAPRVSIVASAPCDTAPPTSAPTSVAGGSATRWRERMSAVSWSPVVTVTATGPARTRPATTRVSGNVK
jgi:hypothetical protein